MGDDSSRTVHGLFIYKVKVNQNYFIEPYTINMQISFFFNKVQHLTIIWEMNTFMQSHSHTLIINLGWGIREHSSVHSNITLLSLAAWNNQGEKG